MRVPKTAAVLVALLLSLVGLALAFVGLFVFAYTNYCEDTCDKPPWNLWSALGNGLPWVIPGVLLVALGSYLLMAARGREDRSFASALLAAVAVSVAAMPLGWLVYAISDEGLGAVLIAGLAFLSLAWLGLWAWARPTETPS
jgi:uncharacterized membrane protein